jgi:myo-inositol-1(or 4)-monophosphatase
MRQIDSETLSLAHRLADAAGEVIRPYFRRPIAVTDKKALVGGKTVFDPVTAADRNAEQAIREILARERPNDAVLGEEFGETTGTSGWRWVLDPVDGTRAFVNGRYEWGSLIALEREGVPVLGVMDQPVLGERFVGANGETRLHDRGGVRAVHVRDCATIADAILCATHPDAFYRDEERAAFGRVKFATLMHRWGGDCTIFGILAMGFADLIVESGFNRWDVAALVPIVEGAGGVITNWQGGSCAEGGPCLAAGDARVHAEAMTLLNA